LKSVARPASGDGKDAQVTVDPTPAAPEVAVESAPPAAEVAVESAPAAPEVAVEKAPAAAEVAVEKAPAAPDVAVEKAPAAAEVAVEKAPAAPEVAVENAPTATEVAPPKTDVAPLAMVPPGWQSVCKRAHARENTSNAPMPVTSDATELMMLPTARPLARAFPEGTCDGTRTVDARLELDGRRGR
jgi:hypothetical protein